MSTDHAGSASMLIRKPSAEVFEAIVNPAITSRFWFTHGSARLEKGKQVEWKWEMYGVSAVVRAVELEPGKRVLIEWGPPGQPTTTVEWQLKARADNTTFVSITQRGFKGSADDIVRQAIDSTSGFSFHLAGMKAWLEHGLALNLTGDHHPKD
jgi:uncharacterized protein YndB with AHSA1/START domain